MLQDYVHKSASLVQIFDKTNTGGSTVCFRIYFYNSQAQLRGYYAPLSSLFYPPTSLGNFCLPKGLDTLARLAKMSSNHNTSCISFSRLCDELTSFLAPSGWRTGITWHFRNQREFEGKCISYLCHYGYFTFTFPLITHPPPSSSLS